MDPTKHTHASVVPFHPPWSSSSKPCKKQIDWQEKVRQHSFEGLGLTMDMEWRKKLQREQNHEAIKDGKEETIKVSPLSNLQFELPPLQIIQKEFSLDATAKGTCRSTNDYHGLSETKSVTRTTPKPSRFNAYNLTIGVWQWVSRYNEDLVAKFYYAHRKLIWEIIYEGLKWKMEIDWEDISALKVSCPEGGPGTLEIMLSQRPRFYKETNQQPKKSTSWLQIIDFTGGQCNIHRRHVLQCEPGILNKHIAILLSSNYRLYSLSQENCWLNPYFENQHLESEVPESSNTQDLSGHYDCQQLGGQKTGMHFHVPVGTTVVRRNHSGSQDGMPTLTTGSDDLSAGPQQQCNLLNSNTSYLQTPHQSQHQISGIPGQSSVITGALSGELQNPAEVMLNHYASGTSIQQTFNQINSASQPRNNENGTMTAIILEKISHDLLDDNYMEPTGMAEDARAKPMMDSFSNLLQQDPAPAVAQGYSVESATEVLSMPPNVGSSVGSSRGTTD